MKHIKHPRHKVVSFLKKHRRILKEAFLLIVALGFIFSGIIAFWVSSFKLPDLNVFEQRRVSESTKIYDRTGKILLYDVHENIKRKLVPYAEISKNIKNATIAIEDAEFYQHHGIKPTAILRAIIADIATLRLGQGGSTITQQVIKNSLLTRDKTATRKLKEWVLALKLERAFDKDTILEIYLNEAPYGGTIYGVEQASEEYFGKHASDLTVAESAYLAAMPQAPTFYSPFGNNRDRLDARKNLVLQRMLDNKFISPKEFADAKAEVITFDRNDGQGIKAPHFVFYVKDYLVDKYGETAVNQEGLKVVTTLDYELQQKGEAIVRRYAIENKSQIDAENAALVAIDPKTGQILTMVGSRDYFDKEIDGNFNVTIARRQPGSSFKPFVYAEAFKKGFSPNTVLFDVPTEFSSDCTASSTPKNPDAVCYTPANYDGRFRGPINLRNALAQSINIPAIKLLYLAGIGDSLRLAKDMGVESLSNDPNQYGLTLVLGGGEVSPLEMTSAYGVFANKGVRNPSTGILRVEDRNGNVLEEFTARPSEILEQNIALTITDILSDNTARAPIFGNNSALYFPGHNVAAKTGTTNDFKDMWIIGYTSSIAVGAWAGNNDGRPVQKSQSARQVVAPMWNAFMYEAFKKMPDEKFPKPAPLDTPDKKPILRGFWQGNTNYFIDKITGKLATEFTPPETKEERVIKQYHSILYWVDRNNILGPVPTDPKNDPSFENWETSVRDWVEENGYIDETSSVIPTMVDDVHKPEFAPSVSFITPDPTKSYARNIPITVTASTSGHFPVVKADYYLGTSYLGSAEQAPWKLRFTLNNIDNVRLVNKLRVVVTDSVGNKSEASQTITVGGGL